MEKLGLEWKKYRKCSEHYSISEYKIEKRYKIEHKMKIELTKRMEKTNSKLIRQVIQGSMDVLYCSRKCKPKLKHRNENAMQRRIVF